VSADPDNKLGLHVGQFIPRPRAHRGNDRIVLPGRRRTGVGPPAREVRYVTYTYYEQLNGYEYLNSSTSAISSISGPYTDDILKVLAQLKDDRPLPSITREKAPSRRIKEVEHIIEELGEWQGIDPTPASSWSRRRGPTAQDRRSVDDDPSKRDRGFCRAERPAQKNNRDHVDISSPLHAKEGFDWIWCEHALTSAIDRASPNRADHRRATRDAPGKTARASPT